MTTVIDSTRDPPPQPSRGPRHRQSGIPDVDTLLLELANGQAGSITGPLVTMGAVAGDPVAVQSFEPVGTWLGHGMADLAAILDPRVFIVGGGVSEAGELLVGPAREAFQAQLRPAATGPRPPSGWPSLARTPG